MGKKRTAQKADEITMSKRITVATEELQTWKAQESGWE
jgi:hypothetical protein